MTGNIKIVIVNYRTASLVVDCLHSIAGQVQEIPKLKAVVVDNLSGDGSVAMLREVIEREHWQRWASVLPLDRNGGFAFGNNAGIRGALDSSSRVNYVMLLNPDTVAHDGAIRTLIDFMDSHRDVGIAGSRLENAAGSAECSAHNTPTLLGELESAARLAILSRILYKYTGSLPIREVPHECDWVSGASLIVRREVFEEIGLLDEGYFLYFEETDFCRRAQLAGWKVWFVPDSRVVHLEGASTGIRNTVRRQPSYWYNSRRRYFVKHFGVLGLIIADTLWAMGRASLAFRRFFRLGKGGVRQDPKWFAVDLLWGDFRSILTGTVLQISTKNKYPPASE